MLITVIIPTWNRAPLLPLAIASLLRQAQDVAMDILVVDDGSTDETPAVLADLAARHPMIRTLRQDNAGVTAARNTGIAHLLPQTELVTFLDSDDTSPLGRFATDLPLFHADPALDLTYGRLLKVSAIDPVTLEPPASAVMQDICAPHLSLALMRRRVIERTGWFDTDLRQSEDTDYLFRMFEEGARFVQNRTLALYYRFHPGNMTANRVEARQHYTMALMKSIRRRRADPTRSLSRPQFDIQSIATPEQS